MKSIVEDLKNKDKLKTKLKNHATCWMSNNKAKKIKNKLKQEAIRMIRNLYRVHYLTIYFDHIQKNEVG